MSWLDSNSMSDELAKLGYERTKREEMIEEMMIENGEFTPVNAFFLHVLRDMNRQNQILRWDLEDLKKVVENK